MFYKFIFVITRPGSSRQFFRVWKGTVLLLSGQMRGFREFNVLMTQNLISLNIRIFVTLFYRVLVEDCFSSGLITQRTEEIGDCLTSTRWRMNIYSWETFLLAVFQEKATRFKCSHSWATTNQQDVEKRLEDISANLVQRSENR